MKRHLDWISSRTEGEALLGALSRNFLTPPSKQDLGYGTRFSCSFLADKNEYAKYQRQVADIAYSAVRLSFPGTMEEEELLDMQEIITARIETFLNLRGKVVVIAKSTTSPEVVSFSVFQRVDVGARVLHFPTISDYNYEIDGGEREDNTLLLPLSLSAPRKNILIESLVNEPLRGMKLLHAEPQIWLVLAQHTQEKKAILEGVRYFAGMALLPRALYQEEENFLTELQDRVERARTETRAHPITSSSNVSLLEEIITAFGGEARGRHGGYLFYRPPSKCNFKLDTVYVEVITGKLPTVTVTSKRSIALRERYLQLPYGADYQDLIKSSTTSFTAPFADLEDVLFLQGVNSLTPLSFTVQDGIVEYEEERGKAIFLLRLPERTHTLFPLGTKDEGLRDRVQILTQRLWSVGFFFGVWAEYYYRRHQIVSTQPLEVPIELLEGDIDPEGALSYLEGVIRSLA